MVFENNIEEGTEILDGVSEGEAGINDVNIVDDPALDTTPPIEEGKSVKPDLNQSLKEELLWDKDKRYKKMWKESPNELYKSFRSLEGMMKDKYDPLKQRFEGLSRIARENDINLDEFQGYIDQHKTLKDDSAGWKQKSDYLDAWINNPAYADKILGFFDDLETQELQRQFPNMNREQIEAQMEMKRELDSLKQESETRKQKQLQTEYLGTIDSQMAKIKAMAEDNGFVFTPEIRTKFLEHCAENSPDPKFLPYIFQEMFGEDINKLKEEKMEKRLLEKLNKNKTGVAMGANKSTTPKKEVGFREKLTAAFKKASVT